MMPRPWAASCFATPSLLACLVAACLVPAATAAPSGPKPAPAAKAQLQQALDQLIASGVPGAVVLARDGNRTITLAGGYGNVKQKTANARDRPVPRRQCHEDVRRHRRASARRRGQARGSTTRSSSGCPA